MKSLSILFLLLLTSSCYQESKKSKSKNNNSLKQITNTLNTKLNTANIKNQKKELQFSNGPSYEKLELNEKTIIIVQLDSLEIKQLKTIYGEDNFYTATDDLLWYNSILLKKTDSLGISVKETNKDTIQVYYKSFTETIVKDSTFTFYNYFYFDNKKLQRKTLFELIE